MANVPDQKFSTFQNGGNLQVNDTVVGLRNGLNTKFTYTGELPAGVIVPVSNGGTGASTAAGARTNLGLGTMAVQNANSVAITGGSAALTSGSISSAPVAGIDIANKDYVDTAFASGVTSITGTANQVIASSATGNVTLSLPQSIASTSSPTFNALTLTTALSPSSGGTGVNNGINTLTLAGNLATVGAFASTFTMTGATSVTFPTSGTLATTSQLTGRLVSFQIFTSGTGLTYTKPGNVTSIFVEVIGGGGGGGGAAGGASTFAAAGGGGSGGYASLWIPSADASYTYTVGTGGAGGAAGANTGSGGGTTSFGASLQATGGFPGSGANGIVVSAIQFVGAGTGGTGSNGDVNSTGSPGTVGLTISGNLASGSGASSIFGGGAIGIIGATGAGNNASGYGAGGSGASSTTVAFAGGNGSAGLIRVWEFS